MGELLPVFVYGTLRRGQGNHGLLAGRTVEEIPAVAPDHALFSPGLPYVADRAGFEVVGELMVLDPGSYYSTLDRLDRLEGYRPGGGRTNHYDREACPVRHQAADGQWHTTVAWIYHAGSRAVRYLHDEDLVPGGDWVGRRSAA